MHAPRSTTTESATLVPAPPALGEPVLVDPVMPDPGSAGVPPPVGRHLRSMRRSALLLAVGVGLAGCAGTSARPQPAPTSASAPASQHPVPSGFVRASSATVTLDAPPGYQRVNDPALGRDGLAARSPLGADGTRAVVVVRTLDVREVDAEVAGPSPAGAAAQQTVQQLKDAKVSDVALKPGTVAGRPGYVVSWTQVNKRDPQKHRYRYTWGATDLGPRQFALVTAQATPEQWTAQRVDDVLASVRLPLAVAPTATPAMPSPSASGTTGATATTTSTP